MRPLGASFVALGGSRRRADLRSPFGVSGLGAALAVTYDRTDRFDPATRTVLLPNNGPSVDVWDVWVKLVVGYGDVAAVDGLETDQRLVDLPGQFEAHGLLRCEFDGEAQLQLVEDDGLFLCPSHRGVFLAEMPVLVPVCDSRRRYLLSGVILAGWV